MTRTYPNSPSARGQGVFSNTAKKKAIKDAKTTPKQQIQVGEHGRYQVKSGLLAGKFVARAFPSAPSTARGLIAEATGATEEAAIAALHEAIDARENSRVDARRKDSRTGADVPTVEEYIEAIGQIAFTAPQRAMLTALSLADEDGMTEARMANAGGYKSRTSAKRSFTGAGQSIGAYLDMGDSKGAVASADGVSFLGYQDEPKHDGVAGNWVLYPELRDAVRAAL